MLIISNNVCIIIVDILFSFSFSNLIIPLYEYFNRVLLGLL